MRRTSNHSMASLKQMLFHMKRATPCCHARTFATTYFYVYDSFAKYIADAYAITVTYFYDKQMV